MHSAQEIWSRLFDLSRRVAEDAEHFVGPPQPVLVHVLEIIKLQGPAAEMSNPLGGREIGLALSQFFFCLASFRSILCQGQIASLLIFHEISKRSAKYIQNMVVGAAIQVNWWAAHTDW